MPLKRDAGDLERSMDVSGVPVRKGRYELAAFPTDRAARAALSAEWEIPIEEGVVGRDGKENGSER
jgi:hypothetical protein